MTYPQDSVLQRHLFSATQYPDVNVPDMPQDSVLRRHIAAMNDSRWIGETEKNTSEISSVSASHAAATTVETVSTAQTAQQRGGFFAWLKRLLGG